MLCLATTLYATSGIEKKCVFAQPGTPYHSEDLCTLEDLDGKVFEGYRFSKAAKVLAEILDFQKGTKVVKDPSINSEDKDMPKDAEPDMGHDYFLNNVASFLGEEWTHGQVARWTSTKVTYGMEETYVKELEIDGGRIERSVWFLKPFLSGESPNYYGLDPAVLLGEAELGSTAHLLAKLDGIRLFEHVLRSSWPSVKDKADVLANYFAGLLPPGEEWLIPLYFVSAFGGHVALVSFVKSEDGLVDMTIYNTGDGVNFHDSLQGNRHMRYNYELKFVGVHAEHDLLNTTFFDMMAEFTTGCVKGEKYDASLFYQNVLGRLSKYRVPPVTSYLAYSIPQRAGNCYQKVVLAYLKAKLGYKAYKKLEHEMRVRLLSKLFEAEFYKKSWFHQEVLVRGLRSEARALTRAFKTGKLSKGSLGEALAHVGKRLAVVSAERLNRYIGAKVVGKRAFQQRVRPGRAAAAPSGKRHSEEGVEGRVLYDEGCSLEDPEAIIKRTQAIADYVKTRTREGAGYHGFAWLLRLPMPKVDAKDIYGKFTVKQFETLLDTLKGLLTGVSERTSRAVTVISTAKCLAITWRSLVSKGSPLADARLALGALRQPLTSGMVYFYTPEMLEEYMAIVGYLEAASNQEAEGRPLLFEGVTGKQAGRFDFMSESSAEYQFLSSIQLDAQEKATLEALERSPPSSAKYELKSLLKEEKLRLAYLYMIANEHVPGEFALLRDLLTFVSELANARDSFSSGRCDVMFFGATLAERVYFIFEASRQGAENATISYRSQHSSPDTSFSTYAENQILLEERPLAHPLKADMKLLKLEPYRTKVYFSLSCISQYPGDIFGDEANLSVVKGAVFQGCGLKDFVKSSPLEGGLALKQAFKDVAQRLHAKALVTGDWGAYRGCKDFEALVYRWLGERPVLSLEPAQCPAAYLGAPEALSYVGKKPEYLREFLAIGLKDSYPPTFLQDLLASERFTRAFEELGADMGSWEGSLQHEYPYVSASVEGHTYVYDFWEDELSAGKMEKDAISDNGVFKGCAFEEACLSALAETGECRVGKSRYGLVDKTVCKIEDGTAYKAALTSDKEKLLSSFRVFEHRMAATKSAYLIDFNLSLEGEVAGRRFLVVREEKVGYEVEFQTTHQGQTWRFAEEERLPGLLDAFGEDRSVLAWTGSQDERLYIFTDMFTEDPQTISFTCSKAGCFYQGMRVVEDSEVYREYPQSVVFADVAGQQFALLPMESQATHTVATPCIRFPMEQGRIVPVKRDRKLQVALYYVSHGLYKKALEALRSVVLVSGLTEAELVYLNNIIYYNRGNFDSRPEQSAISYYALYMRFSLGNQQFPEALPSRLFAGFFQVKGKDGEVMGRYYDLIGRVPGALLVTSPILCAPRLKSQRWIDCQEEKHFIQGILGQHPRLSQINGSVGQVQAPWLANEGLRMPAAFPLINIQSWEIMRSQGFDIVRELRESASRMKMKEKDLKAHFCKVLGSASDTMTDADRSYIESFAMTAEMDPQGLPMYLVILAIMQRPEVLAEVTQAITSYKDYGPIIRPVLEPFFQSLEDIGSSRPLDAVAMPPQLSLFGEQRDLEVDLKMLRMGQEVELAQQARSEFGALRAHLAVASLRSEGAAFLPSFSKLTNVLLRNSVISRPMTEAGLAEEHAEMCMKLPFVSIGLDDSMADGGERMKGALKDHAKAYEGKVSSLKKAVLALANTPTEEQREVFTGMTYSGLLSRVKIENLLRPYVTEDAKLYQHILPHMDPGEIPAVHALMHRYLMSLSVLGRFQRASQAFEKGELGKVLEELQEASIEPELAPMVLLMEYRLGFRLRAKNIGNIQTMTRLHDSQYRDYVLQAIMGSGKTEVISPALSFLKADGEHLSMFCPPSTHFETNSEKLLSYSESFFSQRSYILSFNRGSSLTGSKALSRMLESLKDAIEGRKNVIVKFESLQSLPNQFISLLDTDRAVAEAASGPAGETEGAGERGSTQCNDELVLLGKTMDLMKEKGSITFDEVDFTFKTNKMFNFPINVSPEMDGDTVETLKMVLRTTVELGDELASYDIFPHLGVTQSIGKARKAVVGLLAARFATHIFAAQSMPKAFSWAGAKRNDQSAKEQVISFIADQPLGLKTTLSSLQLDEGQIKFMILVQNLIQSLIPDNWATVCNLHYGFSKYADLKPTDGMYCGVAKPYAFAGEPKESSSWANKYETAVKTFYMYLENGMSEQQYVNYIVHLQEKALDEAAYFGKDLEATETALKFDSYNIVHAGERVVLLHAASEASNCLSPDTIAVMLKKLKGTRDPSMVDFILDFIFAIPMKKEAFYSSQVSNNAQFMGTRFKRRQGFSGTAQRDYQFWEGVEFIPDLGSSAAVQGTILEQPGLIYQVKEEHEAIYLGTSNRSGQIEVLGSDEDFREVTWSCPDRDYGTGFTTAFKVFRAQASSSYEQVRQPEKVRAMIDLGAFFRTMENEEVARRLLEHSGEDVRAVVYYNQANKLSFWKKEKLEAGDSLRHLLDGPHELHGEHHLGILKETGCSLDQLLVYYDQKHILGSDFKMVDGAVAYMTVGPTTTRTDLEQAAMRMRGLLAGLQTLRFIISEDVGSTITNKPKEPEDGSRVTDLFGIVKHSIDNESQLFKSPDVSGAVNMQNMQLLYQKVKAQYMDVAFTHLARLCSREQVEEARVLFRDVRDWFIDATDEFTPIDESHYYDTASVLQGFSDRMFGHLKSLPQWRTVQEELLEAKEAAENAIDAFVRRGLVEPKTASPVSRKNATSAEVQNENQNQNQNQAQNQVDIAVSDKPQVDYESEYAVPSCSTAMAASMQMENWWKGKNMSFFDDNIKVSKNFIATEKSNLHPFIKTPTFFVHFDSCIIAISHKEVEWLGKAAGKQAKVFVLLEDRPVQVNGAGDTISLTRNDLVNLLILKGDFAMLNKQRYEEALTEWIERRRLFGPELIPIVESYDTKKTGVFQASAFKKRLEAALVSRVHIPMSEYSRRELAFFEHNPRLGLEAIFRKSKPSFGELAKYLPMSTLGKLFATNDALSIASLFKLNPDFELSLENIWEIGRRMEIIKLQPFFAKPEHEGKVVDISVSDVLEQVRYAGRYQPACKAVLQFMAFAKDKRMLTLAGMFFDANSAESPRYLAVLEELFKDFPEEFKECVFIHDLMKSRIEVPSQGVMVLHVLNFIGTSHAEWVEIYKAYLDCSNEYMQISIGELLELSDIEKIFGSDPSLVDTFVKVIVAKQKYPEDVIQRFSQYLFKVKSPFFQTFTEKGQCVMSTLVYSVGLGRVNERGLFNAIIEKQTESEMEAVAFDLMNDPQEEQSLDLFQLIPCYSKFGKLVQALFRKHNFALGSYLLGNTSSLKDDELDAAIGRHAEVLRMQPGYVAGIVTKFSTRFYKEEYEVFAPILDKHQIPYTKKETQI